MARELHGATQTLHFTSSGCPLAAVAVTDSPRAPSSSTTHTLALVPTELRAEEHTGAILPPLPAMSPARTEAEPRRPAPRPGLALRHRTRRQLCEATSLPEPQITPNCPDFTAAQPRGHTPQPCGRRGSSQTHPRARVASCQAVPLPRRTAPICSRRNSELHGEVTKVSARLVRAHTPQNHGWMTAAFPETLLPRHEDREGNNRSAYPAVLGLGDISPEALKTEPSSQPPSAQKLGRLSAISALQSTKGCRKQTVAWHRAFRAEKQNLPFVLG